MKGIAQASNAVITIHLGLKIVTYLVGFIYFIISVQRHQTHSKADTFVKDSFVIATKSQVAVPNDHSPETRKATDSGIEQHACKMSVRASEIM